MKRFKHLKIISLYKNEKALIHKALEGHREAQQGLYDRFAPKMLSVCRQYVKDLQFAEDVMISGFVKVFRGLEGFRHEGSFEGWVRKIMVREAISFLRKKQFVVFDEQEFGDSALSYSESSSELDVEYIQNLIDDLPEGYKMVFVLFAVEGYKHTEIAQMLEISESTSKSQLFKARRVLQEKINRMEMSGKANSKQN